VGAHDRGRVVDVTNGVDGEGPMSAERAGTLPALALLELVENGADPSDLRREVLTGSGLFAHAGTNDLRVIEARAQAGDEKSGLLIQALAYSVAKHVWGMAGTLFEDNPAPVDAVALTGGMARSNVLVAAIERRVRPLARVLVLAEVEEMRALALGGLAALSGRRTVLEYLPQEES
jgi:butyrate kinase